MNDEVELPDWLYNDVPFVEVNTDETFGFIYKLTYEDGTYYFGKKNYYVKMKLPALKSGKQRPNSERIGKNKNGKRVYLDIVTKESNWKTYTGSNDIDLPIVKREILALARTNRELTYLEVKCLVCLDALEDDNCHNSNILGKFFRGNLV